METTYDVIIVGSGPAGASAAYFLSKAGLRVLVLEKEILPRYKTCGGGLSLRFLQDLFPFSFEPVLESNVTAFSYAYGRYEVTIPIRHGVIGMVMRDQFDAHILSHAKAEVRSGITVRRVRETAENVVVELADGDEIRANYLIGADGANSIVARSLGLRPAREMAAALEVEVPVPTEIFQRFAGRPLFIFGEMRFGYLWIFPKKRHLSVGIAALHPRRGELQKRLESVMHRYGISLRGSVIHGYPIPVYTRREPIATRRSLLVGDAAGLADPLSGEGIRYAIKSGRIASQAISSGQVANYQQMIYHQIGRNHIFALLVARFFYHTQALCLALGAPNPFTTQAIMDLLSDRAASVDVMLRAIATLPVYLFTEIFAGLAGLAAGSKKRDQIRSVIYSRAAGINP